MDVKNLVRGLLEELHKVSKSDAVVGGVRDAGRAKVVPLSRISIGFGAGLAGAGGKAGGATKGDGKAEAGGAGGAIVIEPRAFVVVGEDGRVHMLALKRGKSAVIRRGIEILPEQYDKLRAGAAEPEQLASPDAGSTASEAGETSD